MLMSPNPVTTVERFAELSARLADPFADRATILCDAGLDAQSWGDIESRWQTRLGAASEEQDALVARFGEVYESVRRTGTWNPAAAVGLDAPSAGPRFLSTEAQPWRAAAANVGLASGDMPPPLATPSPATATPRLAAVTATAPPPVVSMPVVGPALAGEVLGPGRVRRAPHPLAVTTEMPAAREESVLPFVERQPGASGLPRSPPRAPRNPLGGTLDAPTVIASAALPFAPAESGAESPASSQRTVLPSPSQKA